jgi:formyl-CoA transferase
MNLVRVKFRDQQRLAAGPLGEYPNKTFGDEVPRSGNASGGGQPGWAVRTKPGGPNDYIYVIVQPQLWEPICKLIGRPELAGDPNWSTPEVRISKLDKMFELIETWTLQHDKFEAMDKLNELDVPCGPILSTKDLIDDEALNARGMIVEVDHPKRGPYKTVGSPIWLSDSPVEVQRSPLLGEHTVEILCELDGFDDKKIEELRAAGVV